MRRMDRSVSLVQLQLGVQFQDQPRQKVHGTVEICTFVDRPSIVQMHWFGSATWSTWLKKRGHGQPNPKSSKHPIFIGVPHVFCIDDASLWAMFPMSCLCWAAFRAKLAPKGPKLPLVEHDLDFNAACWKPAIFPTLGLFWAQLRRQMPPHRTKLRMLSPTHVQTCPSCAMLDPVRLKFGPSWSQLAPVLRKLRPSWAQDQRRPSLTPVGFGWAK